jgi:protein-tyrosine phosphatase
MFVCLGNICRSPLARALFAKHADAHGIAKYFHIDSAGTSGNHTGENADIRTIQNARKNGLIFNHAAKQFTPEHLDAFDLIVVMDRSNERSVQSLCTKENQLTKIHLMRKWDTEAQELDVPDPWYGDSEGFEEVFQILNRSTLALLKELKP